ncbi:cysteine--tRNA ligase [Bartonella tamiae]|uniref:Cysteine--tRNA ligase n=1 Tax=Bartonella tamiae Th239 TaxID=1094558 RepID=J1K0S4_9HYPH|nr:cysteine--tRNA ligase [Bartonella tamiae]EJF90645.1 cysteinyl-tRNA synthetase [Bartonella tamiae Th239]EJF93978.1 cysteinyl-tRNA synthetase [Bartonella tamiae Th307]
MTNLRFYNTLTRKKEEFHPIDETKVRLYVCGPTVYDYAHIGNARPVIVFDILFRLLRSIYGPQNVIYARNITDVDDKINARAKRDYPELPLNDAIKKVTENTNKQFQNDVTLLGCLPPTSQPRATDHLHEMRTMIERLIDKGHAYVAEDHVLFSVSSMGQHPAYGALARRTLDEMIAGARVDVAAYKRDEMDFVLWKPSRDHEPGWPSPAGIVSDGRPGWHIECSAMSMAKLLQPYGGGLQCDDPTLNVFDIHGGGIDLVFPHHENEIAQSCSAFGAERMANFWMHNGFLQVEGQKMSKSLGNFITIRNVVETKLAEFPKQLDNVLKNQWAGLAARFSMLQTHYREPLNWTAQRLEQSSRELYSWYHFLRQSTFKREFYEKNEDIIQALSEDLNTSQAITFLRQYYKQGDAQALGDGLRLIGLLHEDWVKIKECPLFKKDIELDTDYISQKIAQRLDFIRDKQWAKADQIRDELALKNIVLQDVKDPQSGEKITRWEPKIKN